MIAGKNVGVRRKGQKVDWKSWLLERSGKVSGDV